MAIVAREAPARAWHPAREAARATMWLAHRTIRNVLREPVAWIPSIIFPLFFYAVQSASLSGFAQRSGIENYTAFVLPVSILFSVSNEGAGLSMVIDVERGYFDKLLVTPTSRIAILLGAMGANFARVTAQALIVTAVALATGLDFQTGLVGAVLMVLLASLWGIAFAGLGMGVALKTGSENATNGAQIFIFPMLFLTTSFAPREVMTGWLDTAVGYNPITYLLEAMRSFSLTGWDAAALGKGLVAVACLGTVTVSFSLWALRTRAR